MFTKFFSAFFLFIFFCSTAFSVETVFEEISPQNPAFGDESEPVFLDEWQESEEDFEESPALNPVSNYVLSGSQQKSVDAFPFELFFGGALVFIALFVGWMFLRK
jgi:hypothetical protein